MGLDVGLRGLLLGGGRRLGGQGLGELVGQHLVGAGQEAGDLLVVLEAEGFEGGGAGAVLVAAAGAGQVAELGELAQVGRELLDQVDLLGPLRGQGRHVREVAEVVRAVHHVAVGAHLFLQGGHDLLNLVQLDLDGLGVEGGVGGAGAAGRAAHARVQVVEEGIFEQDVEQGVALQELDRAVAVHGAAVAAVGGLAGTAIEEAAQAIEEAREARLAVTGEVTEEATQVDLDDLDHLDHRLLRAEGRADLAVLDGEFADGLVVLGADHLEHIVDAVEQVALERHDALIDVNLELLLLRLLLVVVSGGGDAQLREVLVH